MLFEIENSILRTSYNNCRSIDTVWFFLRAEVNNRNSNRDLIFIPSLWEHVRLIIKTFLLPALYLVLPNEK
jgi:hypothetical protein